MILDTNALSALAEGESAAVRKLEVPREVMIPVIVLGEYRFGIGQSRARREYERWLEGMVAVSRVLEVDEETAIRYAEIRLRLQGSGTPIPSNDAWIAALCHQYGLPILSRDRHFDLIPGVTRLGW